MTILDTAAALNVRRRAAAPDQRIGLRLRARRLEIGMSQERLAELVGITFQQIQKYERGANRVAAARLQQLACVLEAPIARFLPDLVAVDANTGCAELEALLAAPEGLALARAFASLKTRAVRNRLVELAAAIAAGQA